MVDRDRDAGQISGAELAKQAQVQAEKFGATVAICRTATSIDCSEEPFLVSLDDDSTVAARAVVIATGARYRKLNVASLERFEGSGVHYSVTPIDVHPCLGLPLVIHGRPRSTCRHHPIRTRTRSLSMSGI